MRRVQVQELKQWLDEGKALQLIDTREEEEFKIAAIDGSINIPKAQLQDRYAELDTDIPVVIICRFGTKSGASGRLLISKGFNADLIYLLDGGIYEWATEADTTMPSHLL
jgi:adenylyltransferase/sulfurtransferase